MAVQRLNDDKNFTAAQWEQKNRVYGQIVDGRLVINSEEYKLIKKNFDLWISLNPLYPYITNFLKKNLNNEIYILT